jgi:hypothetical protein
MVDSINKFSCRLKKHVIDSGTNIPLKLVLKRKQERSETEMYLTRNKEMVGEIYVHMNFSANNLQSTQQEIPRV